MKCTVLHESRGRLRVHVCNVRMTLHRADVLEAYLNHHDAVSKAKVYERTGDVVVCYTGSRKSAVAALSGYRFDDPELDALVTSADSRRINQEYQEKMYDLVAGRVLRKLFLPAPLDAAYTVLRSLHFLWKGVRCLWRRRLEVEVLDALSIGVSILRRDFATAGSVMFLLNVGSLLEEWTRKKSLDDLARSMALNVDKVWVRAQGTEVLMPLTKVHPGDEIVVRSGNMIPLDGTVIEGEAMVNQAALTGESMPVRKITGATVYAGTVVEEGECVLTTKAEGGTNRYDKIVAMIEESEKLKSSTENRALALADRLVPWCLGATIVTYALTRNATRAISCLMVDFSCARNTVLKKAGSVSTKTRRRGTVFRKSRKKKPGKWNCHSENPPVNSLVDASVDSQLTGKSLIFGAFLSFVNHVNQEIKEKVKSNNRAPMDCFQSLFCRLTRFG